MLLEPTHVESYALLQQWFIENLASSFICKGGLFSLSILLDPDIG